MKHRFYSKKFRSAMAGFLSIVLVCCLTVVLILNFGNSGAYTVLAADSPAFNNIVNANIGLHPKWIEETCLTAKEGGVGDNYTNKHKVWHADVTTVAEDKVGNDVKLEKSPSYVFTGSETNATELAATYSLKRGNEVVFNITEADSAAKVWADAVAFAQTLGTPTELADPSLAGTVSGDNKTSQSCTGAGVENHNGFRVGTNTGERNMYKGNFFMANSDGALGQYITVRLQTDWKARNITTTAPMDVSNSVTGQTVTNSNLWGASDYLTKVAGASVPVETTSFNYVKNTENTKNIFGTGLTYLPETTSDDGFTRIDSNDNDYIISWDLSSNSCDYDGPAGTPATTYGYIYNDNCAFSYGRINVPTGVYIVLDLNGHTIDRNLTASNANYYGSVFHIDSKARLEIMDSTAYENASSARIEGTSEAGYNSDNVHTSNHKGTITGGYTDSTKKLNLPQTLISNLQCNGGGFNLSMWADLVIHSGTISNNVNGKGAGGAFYQRSKAAVTVYDGYVLDNQATGGGVTNLGSGSGCPFTMYGGVLAYNKASNGNGGAVNLAESSYGNFHGGEIVHNEATGQTTVDNAVKHVTFAGGKPTYYGCGGAICLAGNTLGILESVTISDNKATSTGRENASGHYYSLGGGGVFVNPAVGAVDEHWRTTDGVTDHAFKFRGSLQIYNNTATDKTDNVHLGYGYVSASFIPGFVGDTLGKDYYSYPKIGIGGPLIANGIVANVGVTLGDYSSPIFTSGYGKNGNSGVDTFLYFSSDSGSYSVVNEDTSGTREAKMGGHESGNGGLTWVIEGTGTDADTDMSEGKGESTIKIVISGEGNPTFYYKNPNNEHGLNTALTQVTAGSKMNKQVKKADGVSSTDNLLDILKDRFAVSNGSLTFEYSMLKVTKISVYTGSPSFDVEGDNLTTTSTALREWKSTKGTNVGGKDTYTVTNTFENANFRFKMGTKDLTATNGNVSGMQDAISATDGSISYAGEYSVLVSDEGKRYNNPTFKIRINQVGVEVGRTLYYNGQKIGKGETLEWTKDWIDWNGDGERDEGNDVTKPNEIDQPYFVYSGDYYYPILNADYNSLEVFRLYNPYATEGDGYSSVAKGSFTGYVLDFTYANEYFGTKQPVQFGSHSGGGIQYQTMHRKPNSIAGTGTYVPGVKNAGMYEVTFISSRSAASADENDKDFNATGVYFAANNFAFSSKINIYVDPASAEVELTNEAKNDFTFNARPFSDTEIVSYDNTSNTHVNPHFDTSAYLDYYEFSDLSLKAGIYDVRTKLYYTLDQINNWETYRPYGRLNDDDDSEWEKAAAAAGRPYFSSYKDSDLETPPVVLWDEENNEQFDPQMPGTYITDGILNDNGLAEFEKLYEKQVELTSTGKLVYIVDSSSFESAKKLEGNPTNARRYAVFVTLDLDVGYDDYNYNFDQNADHLMGLDDGTSYFWAFEFTVNPAEINPYEVGQDSTGKNTSVLIDKDKYYNGDSYGYKYSASTFDETAFSDQAVKPTITFTGSAGISLEEGGDFTIEYSAFNQTPNGKSTFNYLDASVELDSEGPAFGGYNFGAYNLAVKITFGGENHNYVNTPQKAGAADGADGAGTAYEDADGAFYVYFRIVPVIVTASANLSYTYDGGSYDRGRYLEPRYDSDRYYTEMYESIFFLAQDSIITPQGLIDNQHENEYTMNYPGAPDNKRTLDDLWGGIEGERLGKTYGDTTFYKGRYTVGGISVSYTDSTFIEKGIQLGVGMYAFNTGNANYNARAYHLTTVDFDNKKEITAKPPKGVMWLLTVNTTQTHASTNTEGVITNFIISAESSLDVTINRKDISNGFGSVTRFGDKTFAHVSSAGGDKLTSSATGARYPYAGDSWGYFPAVKFEYVPSFEVATDGGTETKYYGFGGSVSTADFDGMYDPNAASYKSQELNTKQTGKEGDNFDGLTLTYSSNSSATESATVRVIGSGNYSGTFMLNFAIDSAKIKATYLNAEQPVFDKQTHAVGLTYENVSSFGSKTGLEAYQALNTNTAYGEGDKAILRKISDDGSVSGYAQADMPLPGSAITVDYRASKDVYKVEEEWDTDAPIDAKTYDVRITVANSNFAFEDSANFIKDSGYSEIEQTDTAVYVTHTILPAEVTVEVTNTGSKYTGEAQSANLSFANKLTSGNAAYQYVVPEPSEYSITKYSFDGTGVYGGSYNEGKAPVHVGNYNITIQLTPTSVSVGGGSYTFNNYCFTLEHSGNDPTFTAGTTINKVFNITKAEIRLSDLVSSSYNGNAQQPALTFENSERGNDEIPVNGGSEIGNETFYTVEYAPGETGADNMKTGAEYFIMGGKVPCYADTYNVVVTLVNYGARDFVFILHSGDNKGQELDEDGKIIKDDYVITPALVLVNLNGDSSITYNAQSHKLGVTFTSQTSGGVVPNTSSDYKITYNYDGWNGNKPVSGENDFKDAGRYTLSVKLTQNGNFAFRQIEAGKYQYEDNSLLYSIVAKNLNEMTLPDGVGTPTDKSMEEVVKLDNGYKFVEQGGKVTIKKADGGDVIFTGSAIEPVLDVLGLEKNADGSRQELVRGTDYTISYLEQINAGKATVKITGGSNNYTGIIEIDYTILPKSLGTVTYVTGDDGGKTTYTFTGEPEPGNDSEISETSIRSIDDKTYTGNARAFSPSLSYAQVTLSDKVDVWHFFCKKDGDKWVETSSILEAGTYRAVVVALEKGKNNAGSDGNGSGNYTGNFVCEFEITPAALEVYLDGQDTVTYDGLPHQFNVRFTSSHAIPSVQPLPEEHDVQKPYVFEEYKLQYTFTPNSEHIDSASLLFNLVGKYIVKVYLVSPNFQWAESVETKNDEGGDYVELTYIINPVEITVSAATPTFTFNNDVRMSDVTFNNTINGQIPQTSPKSTHFDGTPLITGDDYWLVFDGGKINSEEAFKGYTSEYFTTSDRFKNVGTYTVKVVLKPGCNFKFVQREDASEKDVYEATYTYEVTPAVLSIESIESTVYDGAEHEPELKFSVVGEAVEDFDSLLKKDEIYTVSIKANNIHGVNSEFPNGGKPKNADTYTLTVTLGHTVDGKFVQDESKKGNFVFVDLTNSGTKSTMDVEYIINPFDFTQNEGSRIERTELADGYTFTGSAITPVVTLTDTVVAEVNENGRMVAGTDYITAYSNNVNAAANGEENAPTITFTGQGNYTGVYSLEFTIVAVSLGTNKLKEESGNYSFTYTDESNGVHNVTGAVNGNDSELFEYGQLDSSYMYNASVRPATFTLFYKPAKGSDGVEPPRQTLGNGFDYALSYYVFLKEEGGKEIWKKIEEGNIKDVGRYLLFLDANDYEDAANKNYSGAYIIGFTITPAKVTVTFDDVQTDESGKLNFVYNGQPHNNALTFISCEDVAGSVTPVSADYTTQTEYNGEKYGFESSENNKNVGTYTVTVSFNPGENGLANFAWDKDYSGWNGELKQLKPTFDEESAKASLTFEITQLEVDVQLDDRTTYYYTGANRVAGVEFPGADVRPANGDYSLEYYSAEEGQSDKLNAVDARQYKVKFILKNKNFKLKKRDNTEEESSQNDYKFITDESGKYFEIKPAEISVSLVQTTAEYNGESHTVTAVFSNLVGGTKVPDTKDYGLTFRKGEEGEYSVIQLINAGVYSVKVTLSSKNYKFRGADTELLSEYLLEFIVTPKIISVSLDSMQCFYDGNTHVPTSLFNVLFAQGTSSLELDDSDYSLKYYKGLVEETSSVTEFQDAATYIVQVELKNGGNYAFSSLGNNEYVYLSGLNYLINARAFDENTSVEVTFDTTDQFVYTGSSIEPKVVSVKVTFKSRGSDGAENSETITLSENEYNVAYNNNINAGDAKIIVYGMNNYSGTVESTFKILPKSLANKDDIEEIETGAVSGSILDETYMGVAFNIMPNISYTPKLFSYDGDGRINWTDGEPVILSNADFSLDKYQIQSGEDWQNVDSIINAGKYKAVYSGAGTNYKDTIEIEFTIETALLYAELTSSSLDYTGSEHILSDLISFYNASGTNVTPATSTDNKYYVYAGEESAVSVINANTYTVTVKIEGNNFKWVTEADGKHRDGTLLNVTTDDDGNATFTFTINKAKVGVSLSSTHTNIYDGKNHKDYLAVIFANNINPTTVPQAEDYEVTWSNDKITDAGEYKVNVKILSGNYEWYAQSGDDYDWNGSTVDGDTVTVIYEVEKAHLNASFSPDFADYTGYAHQLSNSLMLYNTSGTNVTPKGSEYNVYSGDEATTTVTDAGEYVVTVKLNDGSNYIFDGASGGSDSVDITFTVRPMIISLEPFTSQGYDGKTHEAQISFINASGYKQDIKNYSVSYAVTESDNNNASLYEDKPFNAGRYTVKVTLKHEGEYGNYAFTQQNIEGKLHYTYETSGLFEIVKRDVTIMVGDGESIYGEALPNVNTWGFTASGLVTDGVQENNDTEESLDITLMYNASINPLTTAGTYPQTILATAGSKANPNYNIAGIEYGTFTMKARTVEIKILSDSSVYGTYHKGDVLPLVKDTHWSYIEYFDILDNDLARLAFYLGDTEPDTKYAPVGEYGIMGTWAYGVSDDAAAKLNYNITFIGEKGGDKGIYTVTPADIVINPAADWNPAAKPFRNGDSGKYAMTFPVADYIRLVGDYVLRTGEDNGYYTQMEFDGYYEDGETAYFKFIAHKHFYNEDDEGVIIKLYKPQFTGENENASGFEADKTNGVWKVFTVGKWTMKIEVTNSNHKSLTCQLNYTIIPVEAAVVLNPTVPALSIEYGLEYLFPENHDGSFTHGQITELNECELTNRLYKYIFSSDNWMYSTILSISGLEPLVGNGNMDAAYALLKENVRIEVIPKTENGKFVSYLSTSGRLNVGVYDIRIVAIEGCGFTATFATGGCNTDRLTITQRKLSMDWAREEFEEDGTQIVKLEDGRIIYTYTGKGYTQSPEFFGIFATDGVSDVIKAPHYEFRLPDGSVINSPRDVLELNGKYVVFVYPELEGTDSANYRLPDVLETYLQIVPRNINVQIKDESSYYGEYTDAEIGDILSDVEKYTELSWLGAGDSVSSLNLTLLKQEGLNAGDYEISATYDNINYAVTFMKGTYRIIPKAAIVTIGDIERTFGDEDADLFANYTAVGVLEGETLNLDFNIEGATYYDNYLNGNVTGRYLEVCDNPEGYAIVGVDLDANYEITFVGNRNGVSGNYVVHKAQNAWKQLFLFDYVIQGNMPFPLDLPIANFGPTVIEYYYDEEMTQKVEIPVNELETGVYYAKACVYETKNFTGLPFENHVFEVVTNFIPRDRNFNILPLSILLTVEIAALAYALIFVRRRKNKNNNEEGR